MKKLIVLGNWKSEKTLQDATVWMETFASLVRQSERQQQPDVTTILCPAFIHLPYFSGHLGSLPLRVALGAQTISAYPAGPYTGEISADMLSGLVSYAMIGHSERRRLLGETDASVRAKVEMARAREIAPVVCVSELDEVRALHDAYPDYETYGTILYEPLAAIGSGQPDTPENADAKASEIQAILGKLPVLYGGSVKPENASGFFAMPHISGVGVGGASLDPGKFYEIIESAGSSG
ncbi:triose-phosphate isomerase [Patescibacteria group bacterium]|nr:triose-phosphate isomerase [Patescibacteria group bacterium]